MDKDVTVGLANINSLEEHAGSYCVLHKSEEDVKEIRGTLIIDPDSNSPFVRQYEDGVRIGDSLINAGNWLSVGNEHYYIFAAKKD